MQDPILTDRQVADFDRQGFLIVRGMFDADEMREITAWTDEMQAWPETPGRHMMYFEESRIEADTRVLNRLENFVPYHDGMAGVLNGPKLLDPVSDLFGESAILFKEKINFKLPGGGGFEPHQDAQAGWDEYATLFITATVTVDRATIENGCLELGQWAHRRELIGDLWKPLTVSQLDGVPFEPTPTEPGDVMFFDSYVPHRSSPNLTGSPRRMLYVTYNRASEGDHRVRYYADKRASYPPDCEREAGKVYEYKV